MSSCCECGCWRVGFLPSTASWCPWIILPLATHLLGWLVDTFAVRGDGRVARRQRTGACRQHSFVDRPARMSVHHVCGVCVWWVHQPVRSEGSQPTPPREEGRCLHSSNCPRGQPFVANSVQNDPGRSLVPYKAEFPKCSRQKRANNT